MQIAGHQPEKVAWVATLGFFVLFCALAVMVPLAVVNYVGSATDTERGTIEVLRGAALIQRSASSTPLGLAAGTRLALEEDNMVEVSEGSNAIITFFDGSTVTVSPGARMKVERMRVPKFPGLTASPNQIRLMQLAGKTRVGVAPRMQRATSFVMATGQGEAKLTEGSYSVELLPMTGGATQIVVRLGSAEVTAQGSLVSLAPGERTEILTGRAPTAAHAASLELIANGDFRAALEPTWQVFNEQGGDGGAVHGIVEPVTADGRRGVRVARTNSQRNHAESGIIQKLDKDVSDFVSLKLSIELKLLNQGLSGGGVLGTEYPFMVRVRYIDYGGGQVDWYHGFYYRNEEGNPTPNSDSVAHNTWYLYDGNLLAIEPKPRQIAYVELLSSGWDYEAIVSSISLTAE